MKLTTHLSRDRFGWMQSPLRRRDHAVLLVRATATLPEGYPEQTVERAASHLVVVLDRSGSMAGPPLEQAKLALCSVVDRLSPGDSFGLVTFDDEVHVVVPAGPVVDRADVKQRIMAMRPGGTTALAAGLVRGHEEARRLDIPHGVRVLLVSDGHANVGVTDPELIGARVSAILQRGITTSSLGMGLHYDEELLSVISRAGSGNEYFAQDADAAAGAIGQECGELLGQRFLSCRLTVRPASGISRIEVVNDATVIALPDGLQVDLGGMAVDDSRSLVIEATPHTATRPGRRKIATVRLDYVLSDDLTDHSVSTTVWTQVTRLDEREGTVDRDVVGEWFLQRVLRRKRRAAVAMARGDREAAVRWFEKARRLADRASAQVPRRFREELQAEVEQADELLHLIPHADAFQISGASKSLSAETARRTRRRR